jgi:hypothetical protein
LQWILCQFLLRRDKQECKEKSFITLNFFTKGKQNIKSIDIINPAVKANWKWNNGQLEIEMPGVNFTNDDVKAIALRINLKW